MTQPPPSPPGPQQPPGPRVPVGGSPGWGGGPSPGGGAPSSAAGAPVGPALPVHTAGHAPQVPPARGLSGWLARRAAAEASTPVEIRVARLGVRSALIGALIGAIVAGGLSYAAQLRAEATATLTTLQSTRQQAYADLIASTTSLAGAALDYAALATTTGHSSQALDEVSTAFGDALSEATVATARVQLVGSDDVAGPVAAIEELGYSMSANLSTAHVAALNDASQTDLDEYWATYQDQSAELSTLLDEFTQRARDDIGTDRG